MECTLGPFCCHFHREGRIGHVGFNEIQPEERIVIVISVATLLQGLLQMKAQTSGFKLQTADQPSRPLRHLDRTLSCEQRHGRLKGDFNNLRLQLGM
jgi:hypothetical protein